MLITLADHGITREAAYSIVQEHSLAAWEGGGDLKARVLADERVTKLIPKQKLEDVFDLKRHFQHVDYIFERALNS